MPLFTRCTWNLKPPLYLLGRAVLGKTKPVDHYHPAHELVRYYRDAGYIPLAHRYAPLLGPFALPLFYIGLFRRGKGSHLKQKI
jgi:hypothetical protein